MFTVFKLTEGVLCIKYIYIYNSVGGQSQIISHGDGRYMYRQDTTSPWIPLLSPVIMTAAINGVEILKFNGVVYRRAKSL